MYIIEVPGPIPTLNNMYKNVYIQKKKGGSGWIRAVSGKHKNFKRLLYMTAYISLGIKNPSAIPVFKTEKIMIRIEAYFKKHGRDVDNIIKPIQDALKGVVFSDDKQIYKLEAEKMDEGVTKEKVIIKIDKLPAEMGSK